MRFFKKKRISINNVKLFLFKYSTFILFLIAYIFYYLSLEKCFDGEELCGNNMKWIYKKVFELILSCEIISFLLATIIFNHSSKLHLIHLFVIFSLFFLYSHDFYFYNHGMYNFVVFVLLFILNILIILFIKFLIYIFQIKNKVIINKLILVILLFLIYNFKSPDFICDDWEKGLNNTSIDNNEEKYGCKIKLPKYCPYKVVGPYQDLTKILGVNCSLKKLNSRKVFIKKSKSPYITKKTKKFGFPLTNEGLLGSIDDFDDKILKGLVLDSIFDIENNFNNFTEPEIIVDFSKDPSGELYIDVKYKKLQYFGHLM